jgi:hypothetical protein
MTQKNTLIIEKYILPNIGTNLHDFRKKTLKLATVKKIVRY